ncbi:class I adenylate-forming enzyme family protein [Tomitella gaofuii]|uniref:class I adenylate-forming enzyme family protein n=1 Tax=Tomitella gaofuii TaxID=2760083 RepID=UPI0015F9D621|nr:class I adenylate-forming enzyme family protein [Tomitella gaofuii]
MSVQRCGTVPHFDTIPEYLRHWAAATPDAPAVVHDGTVATYAELARSVDDVARALLAAGVRTGDRVAVLSHPTPHYWLTFLGSLSIGAVWLGLNPKYRLPELQYNVGDSRPTLLFGIDASGSTDHLPVLLALADEAGVGRPVILGDAAHDGTTAWADFLAAGADVTDGELAAARGAVTADSPGLIVYTSGSTGRPKGAVLGQGGLARSFEIQALRAPVAPMRVVANLPINHIGGVGDLCCTPLVQGGTIVFQEQFDAGAMLAAVEDHGVNAFLQVPTTLKLLTEHPAFATTDLSGLKYVSWGGGPLSLAVVRRFRELGVHLGTTYGMTEITGSVSYTAPDAGDEELAGTVGKPVDEIDFLLADAQGRPVPAGETGEVLVRHPGLLLEYFGNPAATAEAFTADGYFRTGDVGYLRPDGNLCLVARTKEIFKSGGYNTYPREIELVLEEHPAVRLAAVVPAAHPTFQEVGVAYLETVDADGHGTPVDPDELTDWCRARLANYKVPKRIIAVDALPLLPVGKVDKMALRRRAAEEVAPQFA